jgi:hypothetical protein
LSLICINLRVERDQELFNSLDSMSGFDHLLGNLPRLFGQFFDRDALG